MQADVVEKPRGIPNGHPEGCPTSKGIAFGESQQSVNLDPLPI